MQLGREMFDLTKQIGTPQPDLGSVVPSEPGRGHSARHRGIGVEEFGDRPGGRHVEDLRVPGLPPATRFLRRDADCPGSPWSLPSSIQLRMSLN
jgi:hypothetical protein